MPELFSADWTIKYQQIWNSHEGVAEELGRMGFSSIVAFGIDGEDKPRCVLHINEGKVIAAGPPADEDINWDLRASEDNWNHLLEKPPGLMKLGLAYTSRKIKFHKGDYAVMIKDPGLSKAFVKCFSLMSQVSH
ncbi:MAG: SCP-2 sterol transfer family protein [Gammaproteobacteria bacterium]|nr:SCP-2 sterol transfer family protein [Gammaproteobacteria bacterium]